MAVVDRLFEAEPRVYLDVVDDPSIGAPDAEVVFGGKTKWQYKGMAVVFVDGKVTDVQF